MLHDCVNNIDEDDKQDRAEDTVLGDALGDFQPGGCIAIEHNTLFPPTKP